ncbi:ankyrin repeat domain-containing protein 27 isoform X1 [Sagmatias obliquidens]|uniref:ankyrin repeat domain-containing protein 27 isoform X1 n=1 Tax=Sagmatias obliquidens TaxID=3371155 RepID=UPI000F43E9E7|nr:ankyrin repeat domain-containing protein 27 isoform X1 [Lagenorhynchus obliquidens]XP_026935097.1 ankyrin repeat domain-containing protein 27 isoform X1 [Lagenorhynchus obliquidens]XP_026935098.1 ankyrin repeat domain-containing protein 27 isoform X1 [Lagenorhynchus obliquidens]XP_026935099.1 ankyrin repeat domain-containing protein 27 isoform X1 [Lagenorhynchus obliquidens]XP_026935100.1 ankyrin repeat domain-containing protein 27 isoform X1 [Lagenorhynchus obliquidens]XP_026935101.1 ankyr
MTAALEGPRVSWCLHRGNFSICWAVLPAPSTGLQEATGLGCGEVLVPCKGSLSGSVQSTCQFESYILIPVEEHFQTLNGKDVFIQGNRIKLGAGFACLLSVPILFEETFYNEKEESFSILCIAHPLEKRESSEEPSTPSDPFSLKTIEDVREFLGRHAERFDRNIASFQRTFRECERKSLRHHIDSVNALYTRCLQQLLRDSHLKVLAKQEAQMNLMKQAVEMYVQHDIYDLIFKYVGTMEASEDAAFNKITRSLQDLQQKDIGVKPEFSFNIPRAKRELAQLNRCTSPQQKLACLWKVVQLITQSPSQRVNLETMCADDLLSVLLYLLVKTEIPNWMANLSYIKNFRFSSSAKDELGYCLTSVEAAIEYIRQGSLSVKPLESEGFGDRLFLKQRMSLLSQLTSTPIDCLFQHIASGNQKEVERLLSQEDRDKDAVQKMCHPLCFCDDCEKLVSGRLNDPSIVTPFSRDDRGHTPLHVAALCGQASLIDFLVSKGAVVNATDYHGSTPLHLACQKGCQSVTLLLLHYKASTEVQDNNGNTPLHLACTYGHEDCVKALVYYDVQSCRLDIGNEKGDTPLHIAARWGYQSIIETLLQNGASTEIQNRLKETPLKCALNSKILSMMEAHHPSFERGQKSSEVPARPPQCPVDSVSQGSCASSFSSASLSSRQEEPRKFYREPTEQTMAWMCPSPAGGEPSLTPPRAPPSLSPPGCDLLSEGPVEKLLRAIADGDLEMVRYLLEWTEEDPDEAEDAVRAVDLEFCHPLCQCPKCAPAQKKLAKIPASGLGVNVTSQDGSSPLHVAALHGRADLLLLLVKHGASVGARDAKQAVPLHLACQKGHFQVVKCLLDSNAKPNKKDISGNTPLLYACSRGHHEVAALLLQHGASINASNNKGNTALHEAVIEKHVFVVELLLLHGASVQVLNKRQCTAIDCAEQNSKIMELLQVVPSCVATLDDVGETDHNEYVTVKIRKKWNSKMYDLPDEPFTRQFYFVHSVGQFKGRTSREITARDRSVPNFAEDSLHEPGRQRVTRKQNNLPDQSSSQTADKGNDGQPERPGPRQTAPGQRRMLRRHIVNDAVVPKGPETAGNLTTPQEASISQS